MGWRNLKEILKFFLFSFFTEITDLIIGQLFPIRSFFLYETSFIEIHFRLHCKYLNLYKLLSNLIFSDTRHPWCLPLYKKTQWPMAISNCFFQSRKVYNDFDDRQATSISWIIFIMVMMMMMSINLIKYNYDDGSVTDPGYW